MFDEDQPLDASGAASFLGGHVETIRRLARRGEIPSYKIGKDWRFNKGALRRWADTHHERARAGCILIVDDEPAILDAVGRMLASEGFQVETALGGQEALRAIQGRLPDLVLLDLKMSGMDGPTTLGEIRARWGQLPVIILTGYPDSDLVQQALQYSPITLFAKPADPEKLIPAIQATLAAREVKAS